jgi:hypothetical protein
MHATTTFVVRTSLATAAVMPAIKAAVYGASSDESVYDVHTMQEIVSSVRCGGWRKTSVGSRGEDFDGWASDLPNSFRGLSALYRRCAAATHNLSCKLPFVLHPYIRKGRAG